MNDGQIRSTAKQSECRLVAPIPQISSTNCTCARFVVNIKERRPSAEDGKQSISKFYPGGRLNVDLSGDNVFLRFFAIADAEPLLDLQLRNAKLFQKYSPTFENEYYTLDSKRKYISISQKEREEDRRYSFGIFLIADGKLMGEVSLFSIFRGALQKCMIGYSLDEQYSGKGYTTEAVCLAVKYGFDELKLHRVEAGVMLNNVGSMRVLEKAGFQREGIEQKGVKINGRWEDHQIFAVISDNWRCGPADAVPG